MRGATRVGVQQVDIGVVLQDVARQRQEHRPGRRRERGLDGAMHADAAGPARRCTSAAHLTNGRASVGRSADRIGSVSDVFVVLLAGGDQDRRARLLGVVEHAHGVAEPGRDVKVEHRELAGGLRIAVRHRHQRRLLQAEDVADVVLDREGIHQRQLGGAGIAEHDLDALLLEQIEEGALSGHDGQGGPPWIFRIKSVSLNSITGRYGVFVLCSTISAIIPFSGRPGSSRVRRAGCPLLLVRPGAKRADHSPAGDRIICYRINGARGP